MTSNRAFARPDNLAADHQTGGDGIPFGPGGVTANNDNVNDGGRPLDGRRTDRGIDLRDRPAPGDGVHGDLVTLFFPVFVGPEWLKSQNPASPPNPLSERIARSQRGTLPAVKTPGQTPFPDMSPTPTKPRHHPHQPANSAHNTPRHGTAPEVLTFPLFGPGASRARSGTNRRV